MRPHPAGGDASSGGNEASSGGNEAYFGGDFRPFSAIFRAAFWPFVGSLKGRFSGLMRPDAARARDESHGKSAPEVCR